MPRARLGTRITRTSRFELRLGGLRSRRRWTRRVGPKCLNDAPYRVEQAVPRCRRHDSEPLGQVNCRGRRGSCASDRDDSPPSQVTREGEQRIRDQIQILGSSLKTDSVRYTVSRSHARAEHASNFGTHGRSGEFIDFKIGTQQTQEPLPPWPRWPTVFPVKSRVFNVALGLRRDFLELFADSKFEKSLERGDGLHGLGPAHEPAHQIVGGIVIAGAKLLGKCPEGDDG